MSVKYRGIAKKINAMRVNMGGIMLDQAIPARGIEMVDPFLLIHHLNKDYKCGLKQDKIGVGPHPHRGFAPVTFVYQGAVHHRDSIDNSSIVSAGGTQWMHSGNGIVHSERPPKELADNGGVMEIIQFWVNVPAKDKMVDPIYVPIQDNDTPKIQLKNGLGHVGIAAGEMHGVKGPLPMYSDMLLMRGNFKPGGEYTFDIPENYNALIYILRGEGIINESEEYKDKQMVQFAQDGTSFSLKAKEDTTFLILSGAPIKEPIASYGPFVMNTQQEIMQCFQDYQSGKMGTLVEKFN